MTLDQVLTNARIVLDGEILHGTVVLRGATIVDVQPGRSALTTALDLHGDHLMPGVIDVHTDNLERQVEPRPGARWPSRSAMLAHDAQCAAAGVTTVLDALCLGDLGFDQARAQTFRDGVRDLDALADADALRCEHFLHLRCELPAADMPTALDTVADHPRVRMVSLMDHSPGVGQYRDLARYRRRRVREGHDDASIDADIAGLIAQRARLREPHRRWLLDRFAGRIIPLASHDDDDPAEVARNIDDGVRISEFPVTMEAAAAAHAGGAAVIAGAPNIVRGGSHSGNLSAIDLVRDGLCDVLASDYVPAALIEAAWRCAQDTAMSLPAAVAMLGAHPARMLHMSDRGRIAPGLRADLVQVRVLDALLPDTPPVVRRVWRAGDRIA